MQSLIPWRQIKLHEFTVTAGDVELKPWKGERWLTIMWDDGSTTEEKVRWHPMRKWYEGDNITIYRPCFDYEGGTVYLNGGFMIDTSQL